MFELGKRIEKRRTKTQNKNPKPSRPTSPFSFPAQPSGQRGPAPLACSAPRAAPLYLTDKTGPHVRHPTPKRAQPRSAAPTVVLPLLPLTDRPHMADPTPPPLRPSDAHGPRLTPHTAARRRLGPTWQNFPLPPPAILAGLPLLRSRRAPSLPRGPVPPHACAWTLWSARPAPRSF